jgi:hypothetical protein
MRFFSSSRMLSIIVAPGTLGPGDDLASAANVHRAPSLTPELQRLAGVALEAVTQPTERAAAALNRSDVCRPGAFRR